MNLQVREENLKGLMASKARMLQSIIGDKEKANKFTATALQIALNKDLVGCTEESIVNCLVSVAMLGLSPDKNIGQSYLIKYGNSCTLQIGYKGWLSILYKAGYEIRTFEVFRCDNFNVKFDGWDYDYTLKPNFNDRDLGNFEWEFENLEGVVVACKDVATGEIKRDFVPFKIIEKMRQKSPNQKGTTPTGIWKDWYLDMCKKSAIKKFKNQIALRDIDTILSVANLVDNDKKVDIEKFEKSNVVIEANQEKTQNDKKVDINDIIDTETVEPNINNHKHRYTIVLSKLEKNGIAESKAIEFLKSKTEEEIEEYYGDNDKLLEDTQGLIEF